MKIFNVKEIFKSIQGEGFNSGKHAVFIRFSGCNLWNGNKENMKLAKCNFCDTDFVGTNGLNGGQFSTSNLVKKVDDVWNKSFSMQSKFVVLTGGEPMLQVDSNLVEGLKEKGFLVALETNGSINFDFNIDWVCVSPKHLSSWIVKKGDELKVIYPQLNFDLNKLKKLDFKFFFLQPMDGSKKQINIWNTINYCKSHKPWFPSFQIHKTLDIN